MKQVFEGDGGEKTEDVSLNQKMLRCFHLNIQKRTIKNKAYYALEREEVLDIRLNGRYDMQEFR